MLKMIYNDQNQHSPGSLPLAHCHYPVAPAFPERGRPASGPQRARLAAAQLPVRSLPQVKILGPDKKRAYLHSLLSAGGYSFAPSWQPAGRLSPLLA